MGPPLRRARPQPDHRRGGGTHARDADRRFHEAHRSGGGLAEHPARQRRGAGLGLVPGRAARCARLRAGAAAAIPGRAPLARHRRPRGAAHRLPPHRRHLRRVRGPVSRLGRAAGADAPRDHLRGGGAGGDALPAPRRRRLPHDHRQSGPLHRQSRPGRHPGLPALRRELPRASARRADRLADRRHGRHRRAHPAGLHTFGRSSNSSCPSLASPGPPSARASCARWASGR